MKEFDLILDKENELLDALTEKQNILRKSVVEKNWEVLLSSIDEINQISENFQEVDKKRDELQMKLSKEEIALFFDKIGVVRSKLLKCKIENRVLSDYVNIAKSFVQEVLDKAVPRKSNRNYTRTGKFLEPQPQSVVLNQLF